jgi:hypothetical protein
VKHATIAALIVMSTGAAWSAHNAGDTGTPNAMQGSLTAHPVSLTGAWLNAYLHDPAINLPDKLGNYAEDYRAIYPDHVAISRVGLSMPTSVK